MMSKLLLGVIFITKITTIACQTLLYSEPKIGSIYSSHIQCYEDELVANETSANSGLDFKLPVSETIIHKNRNLILLQESRKLWLFMLHGRELHRIFVSRQQTSISLVGLLDDDMWKTEHVAAQIMSWHDYLLLVIVFKETLQIYEIDEEVIASESEVSPGLGKEAVSTFETIQQIAMLGKYRNMFLVSPVEDKLLLILAVDDANGDSCLKIFEWVDTYFNYVHELQVPKIDVLSQQRNYIIIGRTKKDLLKTVITTYEIKAPLMKLALRQTLTVDSERLHFIHFHEKNYIIACPENQSTCKIFRMRDGQYSVYKELPSQRLDFRQLIVGESFLVGTRGNNLVMIPSARLNCYSSFTLNDTDVSTIIIYTNQRGQDFMVLAYLRSDKSILRLVELEALGKMTSQQGDPEGEMVLQSENHHILENSVGRLRSILLQHNVAAVLFRKISKFKTLHLPHPITTKFGKIAMVQIVSEALQSPVQLVQRVAHLAKEFGRLQRPRRAVNTQRNSTESASTLLRAARLRVDNLVYHASLLEGFHLDAGAKPMPILSTHLPLKTKLLNTPELLTPQNFRTVRRPSLRLFNFDEERTVRFRRLNVRSINNLMWSELHESLFLKNRDKSIKGRLVMQAATTVHNLKTTQLNGLVVDKLFNMVLPQVVRSDILLSGLQVSDLKANLVNGLNFAKDVVFHSVDDVIKSPVVIRQMTISGGTFLDHSTKQKRSNSNQQIYTGKVVIKGTLTVNNLFWEEAGRVFVDGQSLAMRDIKQNYLLLQTEQAFMKPVKIGYAHLVAPSLTTFYLNGYLTEQHLFNTKDQKGHHPLFLIFMSAKIDNKVVNTEHRSRLANISSNAVRRGEVADITGVKIFQAPLSVNNLIASELNGMPLSNLVLKSHLWNRLQIKGKKFFEQIKVVNITNIEHNLKASHLNSLPLSELLNLDYHLNKLIVPHEFLATNVVFNALDGVPIDELFMNVFVQDELLVLRKNLIIEGNAEFSESLMLDTINNVNWTAYQQSLVRLHEHALVRGQKRFLKELVITKELNAPLWNNMNLPEILANLLFKTRPQVISGLYRFDDLSVSNMDVTVINDIPTAAFIDTHSAELIIQGDIVVPALNVLGNVVGHLEGGLDWSTIAPRLQQLSSKPWRNLKVLGDARWNEKRSGGADRHAHSLAYLQRNAVTSIGDQVINGNVRFWRPLISSMTTRTLFPKAIDFAYIARDGLFRNTTVEQIVISSKSFVKSLHVLKFEAAAQLACNILNDINVLRLNASLYRVSSGEPILGPLHFAQPPHFGYMTLHGAINGVRCEQVYCEADTLLPPLKMAHLHADSLRLHDINDMSLDYLLQNRITKHGAALEVFGFLTFDHLVLNKEILLQSINSIPIDSLVLKISQNLQTITGTKIIDGDLILSGPAHVMRLNDRNLINCYQSSIFTNLNYHFDYLAVDQAMFEHSLQLTNDNKQLSAAPNSTQSGSSVKGKQSARLHAIANDVRDINSLLSIRKPKHLLYLHHDLDTQILWRETNETVEKTYSLETQRFSPCNRQSLRLQKSAINKRLFLHNVTSSVLTTERGGWSVKAENYCNKISRLRSKVTISSAKLSRVIDLQKYTQHIEIFAHYNDCSYLLLHVVELLGKRCEVRLLRLGQDDIVELQSITQGIGRVLSFFQPSRNHSLLVSRALMQNHPTVSVYAWSVKTKVFELVQVINGDYDLFEYVRISAEHFHLVLSCAKCRRIDVYELNTEQLSSPAYNIFQSIRLNQFIHRLLPVDLGAAGRYLLVLSSNGQNYYHLYKFSNTQGWWRTAFEYHGNHQLALPLPAEGEEMDPENVRLLLCGNNKCTLTKAHMQHGVTS